MISFVQVGKTFPDGTAAVAATDLTAESGRVTVLGGRLSAPHQGRP